MTPSQCNTFSNISWFFWVVATWWVLRWTGWPKSKERSCLARDSECCNKYPEVKSEKNNFVSFFYLAKVDFNKEHFIKKWFTLNWSAMMLVTNTVSKVSSDTKTWMFSDNLIFWIQPGCFHEYNSHVFFK